MHGYVPKHIKKGGKVIYQEKEVIVKSWYFTCPCAIGNTNHHPSDDLLMLRIKDIGDVPEKDVKPVEKKKKH